MAEVQAVRIAGENRDLPGFLRLPYELRQRIYRECLIEPELWYRRHASTCRFAAQDWISTERPAFVKKQLIDNMVGDCTCTHRSGLVLLRVSRLIHREASSVFWANNTFCFAHPADLASHDFFDRVRPSRRLLIRHICVMPYIGDSLKRRPTDYNFRSAPSRNFRQRRSGGFNDLAWIEAMWESILACQGLQTLELHDGLLTEQLPMHASRIRANLPQLQTFRLVSLLAYKVWPAQEEIDELAARRRTKNRLLLHRRGGLGSASDGDESSDDGNDDNNNNVHTDNDEEDDGLDGNIGLDVPVAVAAPGSTMPNHHTSHVDTPPPPPPPPVRRLALNPVMPGSGYRMVYDFTRLLWFKVGVTIDNAVIDSFTRGTTATSRLFPAPMDARTVQRTAEHQNRDRVLASLVYRDSPSDSESDSESDAEGEEEGAAGETGADEEPAPIDPETARRIADTEAAQSSYKDMLRNFRTNFLVHMRHAIQKDMPFEWGAQQERAAPLPLRQMDALPPKRVKKNVRYRRADLVFVDADDPRFSCQKYGSVRRFMRLGTARPERQLLHSIPLYDEHDWNPRTHVSSSDPIDDERGPMFYNYDYALQRYHPDALRDVQKRIPRFEAQRAGADGAATTAATLRPTLRDGKQYEVEVFGLPPTRDEYLKRVRERLFVALNKITTPQMVEAENARILAESRMYRRFPPRDCRLRRRRSSSADTRNHAAELRDRATRCDERKREESVAQKAALKKASRVRHRDAHVQTQQRQMERKRLPGVALLHAAQKKVLSNKREQQHEEQQQLEAEAEKKIEMMLKLAQNKKKQQRKQRTARRKGYSDDDEDHFVAASSSGSSSSGSDSDDESEYRDGNDNNEESFLEEETEEENDDEDDERWPAPARWTKPEKRGPREKRYSGYAYKKGNRKPARLFYASRNGLGVFDGFDGFDGLDV